MGKIFGISDLPVTIFTSPLEPVEVPKSPMIEYANASRKLPVEQDVFLRRPEKGNKKSFLDMRNGFGKLMKSFSKVAK